MLGFILLDESIGKEYKASKQHTSNGIQTHCFASHTDALDDSVTRSIDASFLKQIIPIHFLYKIKHVAT